MSVGSSGIAQAQVGYPEVARASNLPTAATQSGKTYLVRFDEGANVAGFYYSDGSSWSILCDTGTSDTAASIQVDGVAVSGAAPTLDFDGTDFTLTESPTDDFDITINAERIQDIVGAMVTGNTETLISVTYQDADGTLDFVVDEASINHDNLTGFVANEHIDWTTATAAFSTSGTVATGALTVTGNIAVSGTVDGRDIATDGTKLDGIESSADVTDATNVVASLSGASITTATVASTDKVLIQDADDSSNLKTVTAQSIADLGGGGGSSPTTTKGDVIAHNGTADARVAVGSNGDIICADSSATPGISWGHMIRPLKKSEFFDDFGFNATADCGWTDQVSGTGTLVAGGPGSVGLDDSAFGIIRVESGTTATGSANIKKHSTVFAIDPAGALSIEWRVLVQDLSTATESYVIDLGMHDAATNADPAEMIGFQYTHSASSGNWEIRTSNGGADTIQDSGTAVAADTWYNLRFLLNSAGTSVSYYINDVETSNSPITTNIPSTTNGRVVNLVFRIYKTAGTTERKAFADYCHLVKYFTGDRA